MKAGELVRDIVIRAPSGAQLVIDRISGSGTHFFVLGGWAGRPIVDTPVGQILAAYVRKSNMACTLVDLPGTARSKSLPGSPTIDSWLADISHVYGALGVARSAWIGASLGAWPML